MTYQDAVMGRIVELQALGKLRILNKGSSRLWRLLGWFSDDQMHMWWTVYRLPFGRAVMAHPPGADIRQEWKLANHELYHVEWMLNWWGPWVLLPLYFLVPLPVWFSGRWFIERGAYLRDLETDRLTIDQCIDFLWRRYAMAWPKGKMRAWLEREVAL